MIINLFNKLRCFIRGNHQWFYSNEKQYDVRPIHEIMLDIVYGTKGKPIYVPYNSIRDCRCCGKMEKLEYVSIHNLGGPYQRAFTKWM